MVVQRSCLHFTIKSQLRRSYRFRYLFSDLHTDVVAYAFFFEFMPNWGIAIIILTVLVKILTLPLTVKQYRSMAGMKKIQPKMKGLQEKYADDKVRMQQELMKLYRENKVNPLSGCLPMLMMMPIYFALYRTIFFSAVELYQAPFFGWITDLSQQDAYYITPVLLGVLMMIQMRLNPSAGDQTQQKSVDVRHARHVYGDDVVSTQWSRFIHPCQHGAWHWAAILDLQ